MTQAKSGDTVRIHYTGKLTDGTQFDSSEGRDPLQFTLGAGEIIPGLDQAVSGMAVGEKDTVTIPSDDAYGPRHDEAVQTVGREQIPDHVELAVGGRLQAQSPDGQQVLLVVADLTESTVTLDANHPLAGEDLVFDVELVEIV